ncbi:protein Cep89 homolog isoform X2 [Drosophila grimshawi]|uniref:protein Cep89 homolog isoform X2 n=1 Tax=Drosophila grimshawi TaxID=7222 RepID=UPI000C86F826|nr:protein Cep89 homolog isoform X2 [Drosophila grimshawi]
MSTLPGTGAAVMITDLDHSEQEQVKQPDKLPRPSTQPKRQRKVLQTLTGNFSRRSKSVEVEHHQDLSGVGKKKQERTLNGLAKEQQLEQLLQRLATLHKYNEQFASENEQLRLQAEQLEQRLGKAEQQIVNCSRCQQLQRQLTGYQEQNQELANDVDMLKTLVFRLNVQIECYQDQRRNGAEDAPAPTPTPTGACALPAWTAGLPTHTLTPLLQAYDESLRDKDALLQQYASEFEIFANELKRCLEENTRLLQSQEQLRRDVGGWQEERVRLQAQLGVCRTRAETQTRKTDLVKEKLVEVMHFYEQRNQTLLLDMNHLQDAFARCKAELVTLRTSTKPEVAIVPPENTPSASEADAVQQCKTLLEQLKQEHARERGALEEQLLASNNRAASLLRSSEKAKHAKDRLKARLRMTLQWAQKLEAGQVEMRETYDAVQQLSTLLKHKESQLRGLHLRNNEELDKLRHKLQQKEETIRNLLRSKMERRPAVD